MGFPPPIAQDIAAHNDSAAAHAGELVPLVTDEDITTLSDGVFTTMGPGAGEFFRLAVLQSADSPTIAPANDGGYGAALFACQRLRNAVPNTPNGHFFGDGFLAMLQLVSLDLSAVVTFAGVNGIETDVRIAGTATDIPNLHGNYVVPILAGESAPAGTIDRWVGIYTDTAQGSAHASGLVVAQAIGGFFGRPFRDNANVTVTNQWSLYAEEGQVFEVDPSHGSGGWFGLRNREDGLSFWMRVVDQKYQLLNDDGSLAMIQVDSNGKLSAYDGLRPSGLGGHSAGSLLLSGSAAPDNAKGANGDYYFRSGAPGTATERIYVKSAGAWVPTTRTPPVLPTGAIASSYPYRNGGSSQNLLTSGIQAFTSMWLNAGDVVTSITFISGGTAATTPTHQWFTIYDAARQKLAVTSDDTTTAWAASTPKTLTVAGSPYTAPTSGWYYFGITVVAATPPSIVGLAANAGIANALTPVVSGVDGTNTGLTTPASAPATAAAFTTAGSVPYAHAA
jgi:hypothetical protein